jgi:NhaA family Na+:H+ antiporter
MALKKRKKPIDLITTPFLAFVKTESSGGMVLILSAIFALVWANFSYSTYHQTWEMPLTLGLGSESVTKTLHFWINDAMMSIFFFVIGLEIKRELIGGHLASIRTASLPLVAAIGGMIIPALFFISLNLDNYKAFGIPMATDIAFAVGIIAMLGNKVSTAAKIFLTALAIVDDIGAALVIAMFYSTKIHWEYLGGGVFFFLLMMLLNRMGVRNIIAYSLFGFWVWLGFLMSGIHPTLSGILAAFSIPATTRINAREFLETTKDAVSTFESRGTVGADVITSKEQKGALITIQRAADLAETPLEKLEHLIHPWVVFLIMPIFALANAGVSLKTINLGFFTNTAAVGIVLGLFIGKQIGIFSFSWFCTKLRWASKNPDLTWREVYGVGCLAGIGFTMSIFISALAYEGQDLEIAKVAVFIGSILSGFLGWLVLKLPPIKKA